MVEIAKGFHPGALHFQSALHLTADQGRKPDLHTHIWRAGFYTCPILDLLPLWRPVRYGNLTYGLAL